MKDKIQWLDVLKGLVIILVVLGHSSPDVSVVGGPSNQYYRMMFNAIYSFHMPLMFWIAGFLSLSVLNCSDSDNVHWGGADGRCEWRCTFLKKRFLRLMVPYFFFGLLYMPCKLVLSQFANRPYDVNNLWKIFLGVNPDGALWFLYALFLTQIFLAYFVTKKNMVHVLVWSFVVWLGLAVTKFQFYYVTSALSGFFFVMLGLCMRAVYDNGKCMLLDIPKSSFLEMCGVYTMDIYILHGIVQPVVRAISWHMLHWNYYVCCILMFVCGVIVPLIISKYIVRKLLWLRRLILGMDW